MDRHTRARAARISIDEGLRSEAQRQHHPGHPVTAQMGHYVFDHGPVDDRQHLLRSVRCQRMETDSQSPDEDNGLHGPTG